MAVRNLQKTRQPTSLLGEDQPWERDNGTHSWPSAIGNESIPLGEGTNQSILVMTRKRAITARSSTFTASATSNATVESAAPGFGFNFPGEEDNLVPLTNDMDLLLLTPPQRDLQPVINVRHPVIDNFIVQCSIPSGFMGIPPVNLTIMTILNSGPQKVVKTKQGAASLSYDPIFIYKRQFVCRLTGLAMQCLYPDDWAAQEAKINRTLAQISELTESFDWHLIMFGVQTFLIMLVLMVIVSNFIQHIHLIMWQRNMAAKTALKKLEESRRPKALRASYI